MWARPSMTAGTILNAVWLPEHRSRRSGQHCSLPGQVVGTNPAAGQNVSVDTLIQIQVSQGNQFVMPDLRGMFWTEAEPNLREPRLDGRSDQGARTRRTAGQRTNAVVTQNPAAGTPISFEDASITLSFASVAACTASATSSSSRRTSDSAGAAPQ